jgi:hypothetical protein
MILIAELINHFVNGIANNLKLYKMAKMMKKAADGYTSYGSKASTPSPVTDYAGKTSKPDSYTQYKKGGVVKKAKDGKSFPDLNKDGKITKADILKGRGVIAKKGAMLKKVGKAAKQAATAIAMKKAGKAPKKMMKSGGTLSAPKKDGLSMELGSYTRQIGKNYTGKNVVNKGAKAKMGKSVMKMGGKCKNGC